jgi:peptide/nickel transport system substrate-binding protein
MPDPSFLMDETYLCEKRSPKGFNIEQYCTPKVDELLTQAKTTMDLEKRADLYKQVQRIVADEAVLAWGWRVLFAFLHRPNVQNLAVTSIGDPLLERVTLA